MNFNENIKRPSWDCSKKFISIMNIHRQRFIQYQYVQTIKSDQEYLKHDNSDATTDVSISSTKQKLQQQLQNTAIRWWRPGGHSSQQCHLRKYLPYLVRILGCSFMG